MKEVGRDSHSVDLRSLICLKERVKRKNIDSERKSKISRDTLRSKRREGGGLQTLVCIAPKLLESHEMV